MQQATIPEFDFEIIVSEDTPTTTTPDLPILPVDTTNDEIVVETVPIATPQADAVSPVYGDNADAKAVAFYEEIKERGLYIDDPDTPFDGTWDKLDKFFETLPQRAVNSIVAEAPELTKQILRFAFTSPDITKEEMANFVKTHLEEIEESEPVAIETMDGAREYLEDVYKQRGMRPSAIRASLDALEEDDVLLEEAKTEQAKTKPTASKTEQLISDKENARIASEQATAQYVQKINQEIDTLEWKPARVTKVKEVLSNNTLSSRLNEIVKNPKALVKLADFVSYYKDGDVDYSAFMKQSETAPNKSFQQRVENAISSPTVNTRSNNDNQPKFDAGSLTPIFD